MRRNNMKQEEQSMHRCLRMARFLLPILLIPMLLAAASSTDASEARPLLHPLFSNHAVLQRDRPVPIWGWAEPGTKVTVRFAGQTQMTSAGPEGKWTCSLDSLAASNQGRRLEVQTDNANLTAVADAVLVGDVWLCSGQSNMEMGITLCKEDEEIAHANFPEIRLIRIPHQPAFKPLDTFAATWKPCSAEALRDGGWGGFSATAYFFGKKLHQELGIPIGLIHSSLGGTVAEAWTSAPALDEFPEFKPQLDEAAAIAASTAADPESEHLDAWFKKHDPGTTKGWFKTDVSTLNWREVSLPGSWADCGIPGFEGVVWARRDIELPASWANQPLVVRVGEISDNDTTWLNGKVIGRTNQFGVPRCYRTEAGIAKPGINTITLRVTNAGGGGILADKHPLGIHPEGDETATISLAGKWQLQETAKLADTGQPMVGNPNVPSVLYNGMIAPLVPCTLTGVIWYQGEANAPRAHQYRTLLPALIHDWRDRFQRADLAFHIVSLANYEKVQDQAHGQSWAELREAQAMTAKNVPHCGLAVAIDIGDARDIHPKNKRDVGNRLALSALANTYGKPVVGSGPWFRSMETTASGIQLNFDHATGGLVAKGGKLTGFSIAGDDRKFVAAEAIIEGETVLISSPSVAKPVAVRYGWAANPECNLYNHASLPAVPFRTDDWRARQGRR
jgi:sialate O-acetylesterase